MNEHRGESPGPTRPDGHRACLGLGSNAGPESQLPRAVAALRGLDGVEVVAVSHAWESPAVGAVAPDYLNAALLVRTALNRDDLKGRLRRVEADLGRVRTGGRPELVAIDIDLLTFDGELLEPGLWALPYRSLPVSELLPDLASPVTGETLARAAGRHSETTRIGARPDVLPGQPETAGLAPAAGKPR